MQRKKRKFLGQHFLKNPRVLQKILARIDPQQNDLIIEIGAGKGALTFPLTRKAGKLIAIEKDRKLVPHLLKKEIPHLTILEGDVLKILFQDIIQDEPDFKGRVKLVGNLPYAISSPLLFKVIQERELLQKCVFLLQREVAERVCAQPGSKRYAPLSILIQVYFEANLHFIVHPSSFTPPPQVESALISLNKRERPLLSVQNESLFLEFLRGAFRHRRKKLSKNLEKLRLPPELIKEAFQKFRIDSTLRSEQLSIFQFIHLFGFFMDNLKIC